MSFFSELIQLVKYLFATTPKSVDELEIVKMDHFPFKGYIAMSWCGKLITRYPELISDTVKRHETTHLLQAKQYGTWFGYYAKYLIEFFKGNYYTIPFEVEAYANEDKPEYNLNYDPTLLKSKYTFKDRMKMFKCFGSVSSWKEYIKML